MNKHASENTRKCCEDLVSMYGSKENLADALGISDSTLKSLLNGNRRFTLEMALYIQYMTMNEIKAYELRPDLAFLEQVKIV